MTSLTSCAGHSSARTLLRGTVSSEVRKDKQNVTVPLEINPALVSGGVLENQHWCMVVS